MPLMKGKTNHAFGYNVKVEDKAEKPMKQAMAIAYSQKKAAEHSAHGGEMHWSKCPTCYSRGGFVEKGVHEAPGKGGVSFAGAVTREAHELRSKLGEQRGYNSSSPEMREHQAKAIHERKLHELKTMDKPHGNFAGGGEVKNRKPHMDEGGMMDAAMKFAPLLLLDEGGEVKEESRKIGELELPDTDDDIMGSVADELFDAFHSKNKKELLEAIRAIILSIQHES